jgi:hypothetical protein
MVLKKMATSTFTHNSLRTENIKTDIKNREFFKNQNKSKYSWFSRDVIAAMLVSHETKDFSLASIVRDTNMATKDSCYFTHSYEYVSQYLSVIFTELYLQGIVGKCAAAILFVTVDCSVFCCLFF